MAGVHLLQGVCGEVPDLRESVVPALHLQKSSEIRLYTPVDGMLTRQPVIG